MSCLSKCESVNVLLKQTALALPYPTCGKVGAGCRVSRAFNKKLKCHYGLRSMAVAFTNDRYQNVSSTFNCEDFTVRANVAVNGDAYIAGLVSPAPTLDLQVSEDMTYVPFVILNSFFLFRFHTHQA